MLRHFLGSVPSQPFWFKEGFCRVYGEKTWPLSTLYFLDKGNRDFARICLRHVLPRTLTLMGNTYGK